MSQISSSAELLAHLLDGLWRQWTLLGVAGQAASSRRAATAKAIDPEALLLVTLSLGRWDARLFDEALDWVLRNGPILNIQRLSNLQKRYRFACEPQLAAVATLMAERNATRHWKGLAQLPASEQPLSQTSLFLTAEGLPLPTGAQGIDPHFAEWGLRRPPLVLRGYSAPFNPQRPENLLLRLRSLFGVNVRAEILCVLADGDWTHPSRVARLTSYAQKSVQDAMVDLANSATVDIRKEGRTKQYALRQACWEPLLGTFGREGAPWFPWAPLFSGLEKIWLDLASAKPATPLAESSALRQCMKRQGPMLEEAELPVSPAERFIGEAYTAVFWQDITRAAREV